MLDWHIYDSCFASGGMRGIWSEQATIARWLEVEKALIYCQAELDIVPQAACRALLQVSVDDLDLRLLKQDMALVGRPIVGLVRQLRQAVGPELASHIHFRATTQDIMDTALALQMKEATALIDQSLDRIGKDMDRLNCNHGDCSMIGRTNGQYALPITFGAKLNQWRTELIRRRQVFDDACARALVIQLGGPVGDLRGYDCENGSRLKKLCGKRLGLGMLDFHWQNTRDGLADLIQALGALCASLCKIAHNVNLLASSDICELREGHVDGRGASSAMGHKENQRSSEFAEAVARLGRQRSEQIGELTLHEHERSGGVWIAEWLLVPEVFLLTSGALMWTEHLFANLQVHEDRMKKTLRHAAKAQTVQTK